jgi:acid phosphatase (class A)
MNLKSNFRSRMGQPGRCSGVVALWLLLLAASPLFADSSYLNPGHPDGVALLAPPPAPGSAEEAADLASVRTVFKARTPAEKDRAIKDASLSIFLFAPSIGEWRLLSA